MNPDDRTHYLEALLPTGVLNDYPVQFRRADGSVMDGLTSARVTELRGERIIVSSTRDITEQLAMQKELERQRDYAHQAEKLSALGELLAGVSHELNNPLSIIAGYALMLRESTDDPKLVARVERISAAADRCIRIVKTFLAMARQRQTVAKPCDLNEVLSLAVDLVGPAFSGDEAQLTFDKQPDLPQILADADQLVQVFMNLIVNAQQAMTPLDRSGELRIRSFLEPDAARVIAEFKDNGRGIDQDVLGWIFEPVFTTKEIGTGIGLAFADRIVTSHGGALTVTSTSDVGSTFRVSLPYRMEA